MSSITITSTVGLSNAGIEATHDGWNISNLVANHRLCNEWNGDEHRGTDGKSVRVLSSAIATTLDVEL
jgi:hypothetical protein